MQSRSVAIVFHLSVSPSVTLVDCDHIGGNSSKIISWLVSLGCCFLQTWSNHLSSLAYLLRLCSIIGYTV